MNALLRLLVAVVVTVSAFAALAGHASSLVQDFPAAKRARPPFQTTPSTSTATAQSGDCACPSAS